jgi:hypothetical protein
MQSLSVIKYVINSGNFPTLANNLKAAFVGLCVVEYVFEFNKVNVDA